MRLLLSNANTQENEGEATYARAVKFFGERGVLDAVGVSGYYASLAMAMNTTRMPPKGKRLPRFPE
jgi:hypothetical protein